MKKFIRCFTISFIALAPNYFGTMYLSKYIDNTYTALTSNLTNPEVLAPIVYGIRGKFWLVSLMSILYVGILEIVIGIFLYRIDKIKK